jgi:transcriptional regulator with XRE-family HTH domain
MDDVTAKLTFNHLLDLTKKNIDHFERAKILKELLEYKNISQRELAKQLNMPHSTMQDWYRWNEISMTDYKILKLKGYEHSQIYRLLKNNQIQNVKNIYNYDFDNAILKFIERLKGAHRNEKTSDKTEELLDQLAKEANTASFKISRKNDKKM